MEAKPLLNVQLAGSLRALTLAGKMTRACVGALPCFGWDRWPIPTGTADEVMLRLCVVPTGRCICVPAKSHMLPEVGALAGLWFFLFLGRCPNIVSRSKSRVHRAGLQKQGQCQPYSPATGSGFRKEVCSPVDM